MDASIATLEETISGLDVWHLALPVTSRRDHGIGSIDHSIEVVIVRLTSESGETGWGEGSPWSVFTGTPEASFAAIDRYFRPLVVGARIADLGTIMAQCQRVVVHCTEAKAALEAALFDLAGKLLDKPVWALLGEKCRDDAPLSVSIANPDFDQDRALLERLQDDGVRTIKFKTGFKDHAFDRMRVEFVRENYPDFQVRIDYNQGLKSDEAMARVIDLDSFGPDFIEQPVIAHDFEMMTKLRTATKAPLLADESVFGPEDMRRAIKENICDGVSVKVMKSGGMVRGMEVSKVAAASNLPAYGGDMFETGLAHMAGIHMIAVSPNISLGCEFYHAKYHLAEDLLENTFPIEGGVVKVPCDPGLGVSVNMDVLAKHTVRKSDSQND